MGIGDWGLGIGDWGLGPIPNPQSPIPMFKCFINMRINNIFNINKISYKKIIILKLSKLFLFVIYLFLFQKRINIIPH